MSEFGELSLRKTYAQTNADVITIIRYAKKIGTMFFVINEAICSFFIGAPAANLAHQFSQVKSFPLQKSDK
jgi:hypothetical protein